MSTTKSRIHYWLAGLLLGLFVAGGTHFVLAWTAPGTNPPGGNVSGPITTSSVAQSKRGDFSLTNNSTFSAYEICLTSDSCITNWSDVGGGSSLWQLNANGSDIYYTDGKVGIGIRNPNYPLHISVPNQGFLEFAGAYSGGMSLWSGELVGAVVKKNLPGSGTSEALIGIGGAGGDAPGVSARSYAGGQFDLFPHYNQAIVLQAHRNNSTALPIILNTNKLWVGQIPYGGASKLPTAALHIQADGNVIKVGESTYSGTLGYNGKVHGLHVTRGGQELLTGFSSGGDVVWSGHTNNKTAHMYLRTNGEFVLSPDDGDLTILTSRNVKIGGTYSDANPPREKLHVQGRVRAENGLCIGGNCIAGWSDVGGGFQNPATTNLNMNNRNIANVNTITKVQHIELQQSEGWQGIDFKNDGGDFDLRLRRDNDETLKLHRSGNNRTFLTVGEMGNLRSVHPASGGGVRTTDLWANGAVNANDILCVGGIDTSSCVNAPTWRSKMGLTSDARFKKNVQALDSASMLDRVLSLRGVSYMWIDEEMNAGKAVPGVGDVGLIAQEVKEVFPEVVRQASDTGYYSVDYNLLVAPLVEAIKAQQSQIEALQAELEAVKARL